MPGSNLSCADTAGMASDAKDVRRFLDLRAFSGWPVALAVHLLEETRCLGRDFRRTKIAPGAPVPRGRHDGLVTSVPTLVILRGNSASGKSTVARRVQRELSRGRVAVIGQDDVRRKLLWEHGSGPGATISLVEVMVRHCLARGRTTLLEGIFRSARYQQMCERLSTDHDGPSRTASMSASRKRSGATR